MTLVFLVLTACGGSKPSETEIHTALAEKIGQKKGCATSVLFDTLPIKQDRAANPTPLRKATAFQRYPSPH